MSCLKVDGLCVKKFISKLVFRMNSTKGLWRYHCCIVIVFYGSVISDKLYVNRLVCVCVCVWLPCCADSGS